MTMRRTSRWIAGVGACLTILVLSAPNRAADPKPDIKWETARTDQPDDLDELKALQSRVTKVVDKCTPSTVAILIGMGAGSGVIVSEDGLVLTAAHVIAATETKRGKRRAEYEPGQDCTIVLPDGKKVKGKTLGVDEGADSGMVKIIDKGPNDGKWPFVPLAKSADLKKGQWVVSLGHPGGPKTGRPPVVRLGRVENNTKDLVRTNCTLVGGDSGGPLFDLDGNVIGIHSRIGFTLNFNIHVPSDIFKTEWTKLADSEVIGRQKRNAVAIGVIFPEDENDDAWLTDVDGDGAAGKAGLKAGDTIVKFDDKQVKSVKQFRDMLQTKKPGDVVKLTVRRSVEMLTIPVTLGRRGA